MGQQLDDFGGITNSKVDPAKDYYTLDAHFSDTTELPRKCRSIRVGVGGILIAVNVAGVSVTFSNVANGETIPAEFTKILSTGTTCTDVIGYI